MFFATGVLGPAHSLWASLYANFYPATAFRDASSGASLVSLTYALAVGASWRRTYVAAPLMVLLAAASAPFLFGATTAIAENVLLPRETAIHTMVAQLPQGRIASVPLAAPVIFENRPGGIDVDAIADSDHPSLAEYPTLPPLTTIASSKFDSLWVLDALSRMGVVAIVRRPGFSSGDLARQGIAQDAPEAPGLQVLAPDGLISFDRASQSEPLTFKTILPAGVAGLDSPSGPMPPKAPNGPVEVEDLQSAPLGDDPATGWALLTRWYALDSALSTTGRGVLTQSVEPLSLTLRAGEWWLLHSGGRLSITSGTRRQIMPASPTPRWDAVESNGRVVLRSLDGEAVAYRFARGRTAGVPRLRFAVASATYSVPVPWHVDVSAKSSARGPWLLVFRVRYSPYWHVAGAAVLWHGLADGFANGFILTTLPAQFSIDYEPQRPFMAACAGVWLFQLGLGALCLRSRRRGGQHSPSGDGDRSTAIPDARPPRDA
jgi:hypothetical protein